MSMMFGETLFLSPTISTAALAFAGKERSLSDYKSWISWSFNKNRSLAYLSLLFCGELKTVLYGPLCGLVCLAQNSFFLDDRSRV